MLIKLKNKLYENRDTALSLVLISLLLPIKLSSIMVGIFILQGLLVTPFHELKANWKQNRWPLFLYLAFFLLNAISLSYSDDLKHGLKDVESKLGFLLIPILLFGQNKLSAKKRNRGLRFFAFFIMLASILMLILSFMSSGKLLFNQELAGLIGMHASYLGLYLAFGFFILLDYYLKARDKKVILALAIMFIVLVLLAARIILLGFMVTVILWFLIGRFNWKRVLISLGGLLMIALIAWSFPPIKSRFVEAINFKESIPLDRPQSPEDDLLGPYGGRAIRVAIWECSWDVVKENFWFGVGTGDVHHALQMSYENRKFYFAYLYNNYNSHNLWLETTIAFGIFGLLILLGIFIKLFRRAFENKDLILFSFSLLFFFLSFMEASLNVHRGLIFFVCVSSYLLANPAIKSRIKA